MRTMIRCSAAVMFALLTLAACEEEPATAPEQPVAAERGPGGQGAAKAAALDGPYGFDGPVFDIAALPNGGIAVADGEMIREIGRNGVRDINSIPLVEGEGPIDVPAVTPINGLEAVGTGNFFATRGGLDQALGASLWHVTRGNARLVADIEGFEIANNPDVSQGAQWQNPQCEGAAGYTPGPQSNPYHLTSVSGNEMLIGDAAGNTVLWAKSNGEIELIAVPSPPEDASGDWLNWIVLNEGTADEIECPVQPVPTSVAIGPDGSYYVGELTGVTYENIFEGQPSAGLSRVWEIDAGARGVECPSPACSEVVSGLTSIVDVAFGPDGMLYVVEYDQRGWFGALELGLLFSDGPQGAIRSCDVATGGCTTVEDGLILPGAIAFDRWGDLWVLEDNLAIFGDATVRRVDMP